MMLWISKISIQTPYLVLNKEISKPKALPKQILIWSKNNFQKRGIWKGFHPITTLPSKLLASFKCFKDLALISNALWKDTSNPFVCVLEKCEKSSFLQIAFSKNGFMKTVPKASSKCFANLQKFLVLQK